jgi:Abnormal spindle-like microcephaly-assoc'd, ASPM-SPD-2-Hydin
MKIISALLIGALLLGVTESVTAEVPVAVRLKDSPPATHEPAYHKTFLHRWGPDQLRQSKHDAAGILAGQGGQRLLTSPSPFAATALPPATEVTGFDGIDENATFADPPDGAIAVGPSHVVEAVNTAISVWTKRYDQSGRLSSVTAAALAIDLNAFLGQNAGCLSGTNSFAGLVSDPSVDYDAAHDRFMVSMISFDSLFRRSSLCVAVTQSGDPSASWYVYAFPISPAASLLDFPRAVIGSDGQLYVTGNLFRLDRQGNATFDSARVYAFRTADLYTGLNTTPQIATVGNDPQTGLPADSLTPARAVGVAGMYFVSAANPTSPSTGSAITLWKWSDPFGSNVFTRQGFVTVDDYTQPPMGVQQGSFPSGVTDCEQTGAACIETNDTRNVTAYWSGGTVWAAHTMGCLQGGGPAACVGWYHLGNLDAAPSLLRKGIVDNQTNLGRHRYFPSLAVDQSGNVVLGYGYSSATEYPGVAYTTIWSSGELGGETVLKPGQATFQSTRYGDYASTALDPHDNLTIWHIQEYAKGETTWGTWLGAIQIGGTPVPPSLSVTPSSQNFGTVGIGSSADRSFVVQNTGGGTLTGTVSAAPPFSILSGGSFSLPLGATQTVVVRFTPTASGVVSSNVSFTSNGGDLQRLVTGTVPGVASITPSTVDLAAPPASFTVTGTGFADLGFGLPVVNFTRGGILVAQARASSMTGSTSLTVPFPTAATAIASNLAGLSVGAVQVQVYLQTSSTNYSLIGGVPLTVVDSTPAPGVNAITPSTIDLATPPTSFAITGNGFANQGFGLPVVNFTRGTTVLAQARATTMTGSTTLTVPFPTAATAIAPNLPGLSAGSVQAQVYVQTGTLTYTLIGSVPLTITDTRAVSGVSSITPNTVDLSAPPTSFTITGNGFVNQGFGLPVVNFTRGSTVLAQARATAMAGSTTLTVPFPTATTAIAPNLPGLSPGAVQAQVYVQTGDLTYTLIGSVGLTITGALPGSVSAITPSAIDLSAPPTSFTITGSGFGDVGFGLPVANFTRGGVLIAQARASALTGNTTLTVPFPTAATAIAPNLPGLSPGAVVVQVYLQISTNNFNLLGSVNLTVNSTPVTPGVSTITPTTADLATPPPSFTITGNGFANQGFGLPVVNFSRGSTVLAQARATAMTDGTTLTVPFPTAATAIAPNLPGLSAGPVQAQVYIQTGSVTYTLIGSVSLTITDTRTVPGVSTITPSTIDLISPPTSFTITGNGFTNQGFGLPVVNFTRGSAVLGQARATAMTGSTTLTVPFPTAATAIAPNLPGLSAGSVQAQVYIQTGDLTYTLLGSVPLTVNDSRP